MIRQTLRFISRKHRKPLLLTILACFLTLMTDLPYLLAAGFQGSLSSVSITDAAGTNSPPSANFAFSQDGDTFSFDATSSSDSDGSVTKYTWDFGDGTSATGAQVVHTYTNLTSAYVTLTVVDDASGLSLIQHAVAKSLSFIIAVNFQPVNAAAPNGYSVDSGLTFNTTRGYGWATALSSSESDVGWRDRNNIISPDQAYDTLVYIRDTVVSQAVWELAVPQNGSYSVTVCMGDPTYGNDRQNAQVEGVSIISGEYLTPTKRWIEKTSLVNVIDGKLTLTFVGSTAYARLCWIKVKSI